MFRQIIAKKIQCKRFSSLQNNNSNNNNGGNVIIVGYVLTTSIGTTLYKLLCTDDDIHWCLFDGVLAPIVGPVYLPAMLIRGFRGSRDSRDSRDHRYYEDEDD